MVKLTTSAETHAVTVGGSNYVLRTPTVFDVAAMRRRLTLHGARRPTLTEFRLTALAGTRELARLAGEPAEGERLCGLISDWYELLPEIVEDDIDEIDQEKRRLLLDAQKAERHAARSALLPSLLAIEATLDRHWSDWRALQADREYYDEVSRIDCVRLLLLSIDGDVLERQAEGLISERLYERVLPAHRLELGTAALALLAPTETERKN